MWTFAVGRTSWSARVLLDPLRSEPAGRPAADREVRPTTKAGMLVGRHIRFRLA
jgi:hypothetical protein